MKTLDFDYSVPEELVAITPQPVRHDARLMLAQINFGPLDELLFRDLPGLIEKWKSENHLKKIVFIVNDTRVYPARVRVQTANGGLGEVFVLNPRAKAGENISCLMRPLKRRKVGEHLYKVGCKTPLFTVVSLQPPLVKLANLNQSLEDLLQEEGEMPLPPYIERSPDSAQKYAGLDRERYQTVYASNFAGSAAAPTAGLHFTEELMSACRASGAEFWPVTLNVGLGTFLPVKSEAIDDHEMHSEWCFVSEEVSAKLEAVQKEKEKGDNSSAIICVGTTSLRTVESFFQQNLPAGKWFSTNIFIRPTICKQKQDLTFQDFVPYSPQCTDALITNFHQPQSTLLMLIASLMGSPAWKKMYSHAIDKKFRLFSYGDSSLLLLNEKIWPKENQK